MLLQAESIAHLQYTTSFKNMPMFTKISFHFESEIQTSTQLLNFVTCDGGVTGGSNNVGITDHLEQFFVIGMHVAYVI